MTSHSEAYVTTIIGENGKKSLQSEQIDALRAELGAESRTDWLAEGVACDLYHNVARPVWRATESVDVVTQPVAQRRKKLLVADMDSTLIEQECIDELAACLGIKPKIAAITERAMNGDLAFEPALCERVALLAGLSESALEAVYASQITLMPGARTLAATMKAHGAYLLLVSGGFTFFTARVRDALGFDEDCSNRLEIVNGTLSGRVLEPVLGQDAKRAALEKTRIRLGLAAAQTLAVGDGANDVAMLQAAGLGVAYRARPWVQQQVTACVNRHDLSALLYVQGYRQEEWVE